MPRLAWFAPLPPARSGVAQYNAELLPGLAASHDIDLFVDAAPGAVIAPDPRTPVFSAHDFVWKQFRRPYDLIVYQMGNAPCHDYMWAYLVRYPGLVVLHDGQLHHARARCLLRQHREDDYRSEFEFNHPGADANLAELGIAGLLGSLTYLWPMRRIVVERARRVVVHNEWLAADILEEQPGAAIDVIEMGVPAPQPREDAVTRVRRRHGVADGAVLFVAFGEVTPEKRIKEAISALASMSSDGPGAHLLLAGRAVDHYDAAADAEAHGIADRVTVAGFVPDDEVSDYLAAADVCLCLRWPSSRETSAAWLRCLAAGKATVITDLVHTVDIPAYDPRMWGVLHAPPASSGEADWPMVPEPACVSIDILDEDHSLRLAMSRLTSDWMLRERLGHEARALWAARFSLDQMVSRYLEVIARALASAPPVSDEDRPLPQHFVEDGTGHARRLLESAGLDDSRIRQIWRPSQPR